MEEGSEKKEYIFDTSALISLGAIKVMDDVLKLASIVLTDSTIKELEEFAKHEYEYGKASKEVSKEKALELLEELRSIRNWRNNIIYLITKNQLEKL